MLQLSSGCGQMRLRGAGLLPHCVSAGVDLTPHCGARPQGGFPARTVACLGWVENRGTRGHTPSIWKTY